MTKSSKLKNQHKIWSYINIKQSTYASLRQIDSYSNFCRSIDLYIINIINCVTCKCKSMFLDLSACLTVWSLFFCPLTPFIWLNSVAVLIRTTHFIVRSLLHRHLNDFYSLTLGCQTQWLVCQRDQSSPLRGNCGNAGYSFFFTVFLTRKHLYCTLLEIDVGSFYPGLRSESLSGFLASY